MQGRLKASALAYAILISLVISLITLSMIMAFGLHGKRMADIGDMHRAARNADSGILLLLVDGQLASSGPMQNDLFGDGRDTVRLERRPWGAYQILVSKARSGRHEAMKIVLAGSVMGDSMVTLWLADQGRPLSLCGNTRIVGTCHLPKAGVRRAYIEGKNFVGDRLISGQQLTSGSTVPEMLPTAFTEHVQEGQEKLVFEEMDMFTIDRSFNLPMLVITSMEDIQLIGVTLSGNMLITSETAIHVGRNSKLSRCMLHAPKVTVESGFIGDVQIYGDSVELESGVRLDYPSGIYAINPDRGHDVLIGEESTVIGQVLMGKPSGGKGLLRIAKDARVYGIVTNLGFTELKGSVHGQLMTSGFTLRTPSSTYDNHLLDATISHEELPPEFVGCIRNGSLHRSITQLQ